MADQLRRLHMAIKQNDWEGVEKAVAAGVDLNQVFGMEGIAPGTVLIFSIRCSSMMSSFSMLDDCMQGVCHKKQQQKNRPCMQMIPKLDCTPLINLLAVVAFSLSPVGHYSF